MASLAPKTLKRIQDLWARMMDPSSDQESATVRAVLIALLKKNSRTWHDLPKIMAEIEMEKAAAEAAAAAATRAAGWKKGPDGDDLGIPGNDLLGLLLALTESYLWVPDEERMAFVLWALHTQVCRQFPFTPRLLFISPIENCGKTTALKILEQLAYEPDLTKNTTAAAIYLLLEQAPGTTLLIDEADNQNLFNDPKMRSLFNGGYEHGSISRGSGGRSQKFNVGAPLALGTIQ